MPVAVFTGGSHIPAICATDYLTELRDLLHDPNDDYTTETEKLRWINEGIKQRDVVTHGNRELIEKVVTASVDNYTFTDVGEAQVLDVVGVNVIYSGIRLVLEQMSFTRLNTQVRQLQPPYVSVPIAWARYGPNTIYIAPSPSLAYTMEFDCVLYSTPLTTATCDPLPYPYTEPVTFYAAYLAKINEQDYDEAAEFYDAFMMLCNIATSSRTGMLAAPYAR